MKRILFICADNSVLSQMAEAFLKRITFNRVEVFSAGIKQKSVHQLTEKVMRELGIDISQQRAKSVNEYYHDRFDYVITMHHESLDKIPTFQGSNTKIHKSIENPAKKKGSDEVKSEEFRNVRDQIKEWLTDFSEKYQLG